MSGNKKYSSNNTPNLPTDPRNKPIYTGGPLTTPNLSYQSKSSRQQALLQGSGFTPQPKSIESLLNSKYIQSNQRVLSSSTAFMMSSEHNGQSQRSSSSREVPRQLLMQSNYQSSQLATRSISNIPNILPTINQNKSKSSCSSVEIEDLEISLSGKSSSSSISIELPSQLDLKNRNNSLLMNSNKQKSDCIDLDNDDQLFKQMDDVSQNNSTMNKQQSRQIPAYVNLTQSDTKPYDNQGGMRSYMTGNPIGNISAFSIKPNVAGGLNYSTGSGIDRNKQKLSSYLTDQMNSSVESGVYDYNTYKKPLLQISNPKPIQNLIIIQDEPITKASSYGQPIKSSYAQPITKPSSYVQSYAKSPDNTLNNNVSNLFKQRSAQPMQGYSNFMDKYKIDNHQDDLNLLSKYRNAKPIEIEDDQPLTFKKTGESPQTDSFYKSLLESQSKYSKYNNSSTVTNSNFAKPRPQVSNKTAADNENLSFKTSIQQIESKYPYQRDMRPEVAQVVSKPAPSKQRVDIVAEAAKEEQMKQTIQRKLQMSSSSGSNQKRVFHTISTPAIWDVQKRREESLIKGLKKQLDGVNQSIVQDKEQKQIELQKQKDIERKTEQEQLQKKLLKEKDDLYSSLFGGANPKSPKTNKLKVKKINEELVIGMLNDSSNTKMKHDIELEAKENIAHCQRIDYEEIERQNLLRKLRFHNRKSVDELIRPILNLDLVEMFSQGERPVFEPVPLKFKSFQHYRDIWIPLFLYETYSQMISQRTEYDRDKELMEAQGIKYNATKKKHFEGFIQKSGQDVHYIELKLYESAKNQSDNFGNYQMPILDSLKEFDLVLITEEPLPIDEAKKITNIEYLLKMKKQKGKMLCVVSKRRKNDCDYISLKIDAELHEDYICVNVRQLDLLKVHVYYLDSLITTIREFRTIKSCEFFPTANIILDPTLINQIEQSDICSIDPEKKQIMEQFVNNHRNHFNESQTQALDHVTKMKREDFLLIQGPPGTGKTHTIQGIITMLVSAQVRRILICAPSNAAIDEIVQRIASLKLFGTLSESQLKDKLLRVGSIDYDPLPLVKKYTLEQKIREVMNGQDATALAFAANTKDKEDRVGIEEMLSTIKQRVQAICSIKRIVSTDRCEKEKTRLNELLRTLYPSSTDQILAFYKMNKEAKMIQLEIQDKRYEDKTLEIKTKNPPLEEMRYKPKDKRKDVEKKIIEQAQIICTTLSMSATERFDCIQSGDFEYLIIDEACQCVELNDLIPFVHEPKRVILVGDQQQLPATTFSSNSDVTKYSRSLFERFLECGVNRFMLSIQYRMHPLIREFPSNQFYEGKLIDAPQLQTRGLNSPEDNNTSLLVREVSKTIQNLVFFDLKYALEQTKETSKSNVDEAQFVLELFTSLIKILLQSPDIPHHIQLESYSEKMDFIGKEFRGKIGIITPYKSQVRTLKDHLYPKLRALNLPFDILEINTVDAYQGREKDIIIISCVRGSQERTLGFLNDYRRMNVAITRAKHFLWIIGNGRTLKRNTNWEQFIQFTKNKSVTSTFPAEQCVKSSKYQCYIPLASKQQWQDHKLMNILTGQTAKTPPKSDEESEQKRLDAANRHQRLDSPPLLKYPLQKRQSREDEMPRSHGKKSEQQLIKNNDQFGHDNKRDKKQQDKLQRKEDTMTEKINNQPSQIISTQPIPKVVVKSAIDDIFSKVLNNLKPKTPVISKVTPPSNEKPSVIQKKIGHN